MQNKIIFSMFFSLLIFLPGAIQAETAQDRYKKMDQEAQQEVRAKEKELLQGYEATRLEQLRMEKKILQDNIDKIEQVITDCMRGIISPERAVLCEHTSNYIGLHAMKRIAKHLEQKIKEAQAAAAS